MKKLMMAAIPAFLFLGTVGKAQNYTSGIGAIADVGERGTMFGIQYKHFFGEYTAGEFSAATEIENSLVQANFQFQYPLFNSRNLDFYVGAGPGVMYGNNLNNSVKSFYFAPAAMVGLDLSLGDLPLSIAADWRPRVFVGQDPSVEISRFAVGIKYTFY